MTVELPNIVEPPNTPDTGKEYSPCGVAWAEFEHELAGLINKYSIENGSNTPDFILAAYLVNCLIAFNRASRHRESWYGKELSI